MFTFLQIMCAYSGDGGTQGRANGGCGATKCWPGHWWQCSYPGEKLKDMIDESSQQGLGGYNEIIISASLWEQNLPRIVEALVYFNDETRARRAYQQLKQDYPASTALLLHGNLASTDQPFREA